MGDEEQEQLELDLPFINQMLIRKEHYTESLYGSEDLPFKTLGEFERHYYITDQKELHSMWLMVSDLEDALTVSAQLQ